MSISAQLKQYHNKNIHIVGIGGAEGSAIGEFLAGNEISSITGHDFSSEADFRKAFYNTHLSLKPKEREEALNHLLNLPIKINFKENYLKGIEKADIVFVSQVWFKYPQNLPILKDFYDKGVLFKTITNLYFEFAPCKIISVTGTNGKTTTTRLINSIFDAWVKTACRFHCPFGAVEPKCEFAKRLRSPESGTMEPTISKVYFAGNDRQNIQVLDKLGEMKKDDVLILETSSTQLLLNSGISPFIGVITNITPNHIDDHGSFENYVEAKKNLIRFQKRGDFAVLNYDNIETRRISEEFKENSFLFSIKEALSEGCFVRGDEIIIRKNGQEQKLLSTSDVNLPGKHNIENVLASASAAFLYGVDPETIKEGVSKYSGIKHRLKLIYNLNGIRYYDDTQATTPEATISGLHAFDGDMILLAGGDDKGMNYKKLAETIKNKVKLLILFPGDASEKIEELLDKKRVEFVNAEDLSRAIDILKDYYKKTALKKDSVVLISPAAAHFYSKFVEKSGKDLKGWIRLLS